MARSAGLDKKAAPGRGEGVVGERLLALYRGGILRLHDAHAQGLTPWLDFVAVRREGVVPFWLKPGAAAVTLGAGEEQREERIPEPLRRFL